ncbi:MAG: hypothetical protein NTY39_07745 [Campylobacterales bacterium]|nr:hypothetical protein [Campylobacterales bacterium]
MEILKSLNIKFPIIHLKMLENGSLAIIDAHTTVRILSMDDYKVVGGFKSNILHERLLGCVADISFKGDFTISIIPKSNQAALFSVAKKELLYKVGRHQGEVESVAIDPNSRYCVTCGQDGKVFVWVIKTARLAFTMPPHADFVTSVAFNEKGQWVATGSFDRSINLLNLATMKQPLKLKGHTSVIVKMLFLPEARLLSADKEGSLIIWDIKSGKILKRPEKMSDDISAMCISDDKQFVFVGTKLGYIGLYDMQTMELVRQRYIKESEEITSLAFIKHGSRLAVGTAHGNVHFYSLLGDQEAYMTLLRSRQYKEFYAILEENPILQYSKMYDLVEKIWEDTLMRVKLYLEKGEKEKGKELLNTFSGIPKKNAFILQMIRDYEKYSQFKTYIEEGRFPLAYSMVKQYTTFKDSEPYRKMESRWRKLFAKAQEVIVEANGEEKARTLLASYRGISEKTLLIQQLFAEKRLYEYFKKVIAARDFVKFFDLTRNHPFLKEFSEYTTVMEYADKLYIQALKAYQEGDTSIAKKASEILIYFPDYSVEAHQMLDTIKVKHLFLDSVNSNNMLNAFSYLSSYPLLYETPEAQELENQWNELLDVALRYAAKGSSAELQKYFQYYLPITAKYSAIGAVFAQCYAVQLEQKFRANTSQNELENGIKNYVGLFGTDDYIRYFFSLYTKKYTTTMELSELKQGSLESWSPYMIINDITAKKI